MKQKEIWYSDLNPIRGSEQGGTRPVVILSGNLMNKYLGVVWVAPLTTRIKNYKGNPIIKPGKTTGITSKSELMIIQMRSISKSRLLRKVGEISDSDFKMVSKTIGDILKF